MSEQVQRRNYSRDPLDILLEREARSCKGCTHLSSVVVFDKKHDICSKGRRPEKKCKNYRERY